MLPCLLLACALVTINSAYAMFEEEGPFGKDNAYFRINKKTLLNRLEPPKLWTSYCFKSRKHIVDSVGPNDHTYEFSGSLSIHGHTYRLVGSIGGTAGKSFLADPSQWVEFKNHAATHPRPCQHWSFYLHSSFLSDFRNTVNLEIHEMPPHLLLPSSSTIVDDIVDLKPPLYSAPETSRS